MQYRCSCYDPLSSAQVLSLPMPTLDDLSNIPVQEFDRISKAANDGIAGIAARS